MTPCPCTSGRDFDDCCGPLLAGAPAVTAEALMRSRYTAFAKRDIDYVAGTNAAGLRASFDRAHAEAMAAEVEWTGLHIVAVNGGGPDDQEGQVEFRASFSRLGQDLIHHELATFRKEDGRWVYAESETNPKQTPRRVVSVGRNDPCPCGSDKKYKKCCGG